MQRNISSGASSFFLSVCVQMSVIGIVTFKTLFILREYNEFCSYCKQLFCGDAETLYYSVRSIIW